MVQKFTIIGLVQGIGYRPFVARIAEELNISGWVRNTGGIVTVLAAGDESSLRELYRRLSCDVPTGGFVNKIIVEDITNDGFENEVVVENVDNIAEAETDFVDSEFRIIESDQDQAANLPLIPADIATCDKCKEELLDPNNRRYGHPFISCTICGPRYSIIEKLPYDRNTITMDDFEMCPDCKNEYTAKEDRRRHAQTIACHKCGPKLDFTLVSGVLPDEENSQNAGNLAKDNVHRKFTSEFLENSDAVSVLKNGGILAIKDIGGYHLSCDPFNANAVAALRKLKHREQKAFAVMFENVEQVREYCQVNEQEAELLESPARPIVLVRRKKCLSNFADNVCLTSPDIGAMLPCNPVQIMLARACGPLIMTSGNASGDVLETENEKMLAWLQERVASGEFDEVPIGILSHDRRILRPMDDSVMKVVRGRQQFIRRGRGHVPNPISIEAAGEVFAAGGDLKSSFCYVKNGLAYVSQYLGDLESVSCQKFYKNEMQAMRTIFGFNPNSLVADMHPGYFSRTAAANKASENSLPISYVQHHKAHVASVIAEHKLDGPVLGFAFDGTGYGDDGTIWGSEVFRWDGIGRMERVAHLKPMKLIGGDEGAKNCDTILVGMLHNNGIEIPDWIKERTNSELIVAAIDNGINLVTSTSMGRLFDAVSALLDICHYNSYEGQAPIELENIAALADELETEGDECFSFSLGEDGDIKALLKNIVNTIIANRNSIIKESDSDEEITKELKGKIARGFIDAIADYVYMICKREKINQIVLSGGTFLNRILLEKTINKLEAEGFKVYISEQLPPGDGGICLGQAYLHGHMLED